MPQAERMIVRIATKTRGRALDTSAPATLADPQPHHRPLERCPRPRLFHPGRSGLQRLLPALARGLGLGLIDLVGLLGGIGEDHDPIGSHVHEPAEDRQRRFDAALLDAQLARPERRDERSVVWQDADVPFARGYDDHVDVVLQDGALGRDDLEPDRHQAEDFAIVSAFSRACSIVPTLKKACSGRSSCLPSSTSLKLRTVSATFTYTPSRPVNCLATNSGWARNRWIFRARPTRTLSSSDSSSTPRLPTMSWRSLYRWSTPSAPPATS